MAAAALIPGDDFFLGETSRDEAVSIVDHAGLFRAFHLVALLGVAAAAGGVVLLCRAFRGGTTPAAVRLARALALVGLAGWTAEVAVRLTVAVTRARDVAAGAAEASGEPAIGSWPMFGVAAVGFLAPVLCAWALAVRRLPSRRPSVVVAGLATLCTLAGRADPGSLRRLPVRRPGARPPARFLTSPSARSCSGPGDGRRHGRLRGPAGCSSLAPGPVTELPPTPPAVPWTGRRRSSPRVPGARRGSRALRAGPTPAKRRSRRVRRLEQD